MTLPALRIIIADLAKCIPETILPESNLYDVFGWHPHGPHPVQTLVAAGILDSTGIMVPPHDAIRWVIVQDVLDYLEAREEKPFGDPPDRA
jgi:hypothetical protein